MSHLPSPQRFVLLLLVVLLPSAPAAAEELPSITYPDRREGKAWVDAGGVQVAVDDGIEWQGTEVYLSLFDDLVAVDTKTNKTLWHRRGSAFYNQMAIRKVKNEDGKEVLAVRLCSSQHADNEALTLYVALKDGNVLTLPAQKQVPGAPLDVPAYSGDRCAVKKPLILLVTTSANWKEIRAKMFQGRRPNGPMPDEVDFKKEVLLIQALGDLRQCNGVRFIEAFQGTHGVLVRTDLAMYQVGNADNLPVHRPFGIFRLPRNAKQYLLEDNVQGYIGGPPIWKVLQSFDGLGDPKTEVGKLEACLE